MHGVKLGTRLEQELGLRAAHETRRLDKPKKQRCKSGDRRARSSVRGPESVKQC